jgi:hypothetical protein
VIRPPFPTVIDNTMRSEFVKCPQSFFRAYIQHLDNPKPSVHLHAGGAIAHGFEVFRKAYYGEEIGFEASFIRGASALVQTYGDFDSTGETKTLDRMLGAFDYYLHEAWPPATDPVRPMVSGGKPAVEFSFAIPLPILHPETGDPLLYGGRFDMVGEYMNQLFAVDEKTTGSMGPQWFKQWDLRSQFTGYCWAAQQYNYHVAGVLVRGICILSNDYKCGEVVDYRPKWIIDRWHAQLLRDIERMIECWRSGYYDYNLSDGCNSFGGCDYKVLCLSRDPEPFIKTHFVERPWIPVAAG